MTESKKLSVPLLLSLLASGLFAAPGLPPLVLPEGVGVNIHFARGHEKDLDLIAAAGFKFIRMDFGWGGIERKKGEYDWAAYDELTANLEQRKLRAIYILDYSNGLYEEAIVSKNPVNGKEQRDTASPQKPESVAAFASWAAAAAKHYKGRGIIWEIWNEPNIGFWKPKPDVKQYAALALATCKAVRAADPQAIIIAPGSSEFPWTFIEGLFAAGVLEYLDAVSVHPYRSYSRGPETAGEDYLKLRALIERYAPAGRKNLPIISGEWGYATHTKGVSLETQAAFIARQQLANVLQGVPLSIWYDWKNDGLDPAYNENNFGTVSNNLAFKPSYVAVQTLTRQLAGFRIARRLSTATNEDWVLLLVDEAGDQKLAAWTTGKPHGLTLDAGVAAADVSAVDGQGQPLQIKSFGDALALDLQIAPQYLTLKKPSRKLALAASWSFAKPLPTLIEGGPDAGIMIPVQVKNPFSEPMRVRLALQSQDKTSGGVFDLAAGQTLRQDLSFNAIHRSSEQVEGTLRVEFSDKAGQLLASSTESLHFRLSNPLKLSLAPTEHTLRLVIDNSARSQFVGQAVVGGKRLPVNLSASTLELIVSALVPSGEVPITASLVDAKGASVTEPLTCRFQPLFPISLKARLDGDAKIPATVSLVETNAPVGLDRPFTKAFRLDYSFEAGWRFAQCVPAGPTKSAPFASPPRALGLWIYGDGSGNGLRARLMDTGGQCFQPSASNLDWTGWRWVTFDLADLRHAGHWGGADDGVVHGALRLDTLLLVDGSRKKTAGTVWFAGPTLIYSADGR